MKLIIKTDLDRRRHPSCIKLIENYLAGRTFKVRIGGTKARQDYRIQVSVPQGSAWRPTLFNAHVATVPQPEIQETTTILFADDIVAASRGIRSDGKLQEVLDDMIDWATTRNIGINPNKCKAMCIRLRTPPDSPSINNESILYTKAPQYLGMTLD